MQMDNLKDNLKTLLPNHEYYLSDETLQTKLMIWDSKLVLDDEHLLKKFKRDLEKQARLIPEEAHLI